LLFFSTLTHNFPRSFLVETSTSCVTTMLLCLPCCFPPRVESLYNFPSSEKDTVQESPFRDVRAANPVWLDPPFPAVTWLRLFPTASSRTPPQAPALNAKTLPHFESASFWDSPSYFPLGHLGFLPSSPPNLRLKPSVHRDRPLYSVAFFHPQWMTMCQALLWEIFLLSR